METNKQVTAEEVIDLQCKLRDLLFVRPKNLTGIESAAVALCDAVVDFVDAEEYTTLKTQQLTAENEALKKRLEENRKSFRADLHHLRKHKAKLKAENERLKEAQRWIPVTERLPEDGEWVLCGKENGVMVMCGQLSTSGDAFYLYGDSTPDFNVTHWMPLPNKPELNQPLKHTPPAPVQ